MDVPVILTRELVSAAEEVFTMMVGQPLTPEAPQPLPPAEPGSHVAASVAFAGFRTGVVCFHSSLTTAKDIAGAMLGIPADAVNGEMPDAIGEVANMIAGAFRTKLAAHEPASAIAIPTVTVGSDFSTKYSADTARIVCPFRMGTQPLFIELILTGQ